MTSAEQAAVTPPPAPTDTTATASTAATGSTSVTPPPSSTVTTNVTTPTTANVGGPVTTTATTNPLVFATFDTDGDGRVSAAEYTAGMARQFAASTVATPTPRRGFWSRVFHPGASTTTTTNTATGVTTTGTTTGVAASSNPAFSALDTNHDGYLSQSEIEAWNAAKR